MSIKALCTETAPRRARLFRRALACALALSLGAPLSLPAAAWADVRATDELLGVSVAERGLPAVACPNVTARYAFVMDAAGTVYFSRDADAQSHIASITKVMTAIVALDSGVSLDTEITVSEAAATVGESSADLRAGDKLTLKTALTGLMVSSGNDAAIAIAEAVGASMAKDGQSPNEAFVAAMNAKAAELGMTDSLFANPHGLDIGEFDNEMYSTARDVALMCAHAMKNETFRAIVAEPTAQLSVTKPDGTVAVIDLTSTDLLLDVYEGACGIKTGYTEKAGNSFAGACNRGDGDLYAIVLGSPSENARFEDAKALFNWVYDNRMTYALAHSPQTTSLTLDGASTEVPLIAEVPQSAWLDRRVKATFADPAATVEVFAPEGNVSQELVCNDLPGAVSAGDVVGTMNFYQGNELIASQELISCEDSPAPDLLQGIGFWWDRLWAGLGGETLVAEPVIVNETPLIYSKSAVNQDIDEIRAIAAGETPAGEGDDASSDDNS